PEELATLGRQSAAEDRWDAVARKASDARNARRGTPEDVWSAARERGVGDFLAANRDYQRVLDARRVEELKAAALVPVKLIFALSVVFGAIALALVLRRRRTVAAVRAVETGHDDVERRYAGGQARFGEARQVAENQAEGHELLVRHLEAGAPDATITVLIRNKSGDRLEPAMPLPAGSPRRAPARPPAPREPWAGAPPARGATRARQAARLPRGAPQPPGRPGREQRRDHHLPGLRPAGGRVDLPAAAGRRRGHRLPREERRAGGDGGRAPPHPRLRDPGRARARQPAQPRPRRV